MPVVRHHHDRAFEIAQGLGQGFAHLQVEVVGRFVQQQHVGLAPGNQGQRQARAFAAGKPIHAFEGAVAGKAPLAQEISESLGRGIRCDIAQVIDRRLAGMQRLHRVLGEVADAQIRMRTALARQQRQLAHQRLHQGGLARAVGAQQAHAVAGLQAETDVAQDGDRTLTRRDERAPLFRLRERGNDAAAAVPFSRLREKVARRAG